MSKSRNNAIMLSASEEETAAKLAVHEAVCAERWKQASDRLSRIEMVLGAIVEIRNRILGAI